MYDDAENMNVTYPPNLSPDEQLVYETEAAKVCNCRGCVYCDWISVGAIRLIWALRSVCFSLWLKWPRWSLAHFTCRREEKTKAWAASPPTPRLWVTWLTHTQSHDHMITCDSFCSAELNLSFCFKYLWTWLCLHIYFQSIYYTKK